MKTVREARYLFLWAIICMFASGTMFLSCGSEDDSIVSVTGVSVSQSTLSLTEGETETLVATVAPDNATVTTVTWKSSDTTVATVKEGVVTAISAGTATITVTTVDGGYTASCSVTVETESSNEGEDSNESEDNSDEDDSTSDATSYSQSSGTVSVTGKTYSSTTSDVNAVKVSGGTFTMTDCTVSKGGGDTSNSDNSSFYGINAAVLASSTGIINMDGGTITTNAKGANGIVAYGGTVTVEDVTINCTQQLSRGIHATGGGTITATNLTITTQASNSSVIALDRGGGTVNVTGGTYTTTGSDCAVLYSTGSLTVNNITGSSSQGEIGVIEGDNYITINNSTLSSGAGSSSRGLMILQSGSGDGGDGLNGVITVTGGSLTMTGSSAPLIEIVTNVSGTVTLNGVTTTIPSDILMKVDYNTRWDTYGATGILTLSGSGTTYSGNIVADKYSSSKLTVNSGVIWKGAYDNDNTAKSTTLTIDGGTWTLTGNSYVDSITLTNSAVINKNGYTLTCSDITQTSGTIND